jgi:murein DD-endopeptidase MepM/ murein hydrolase activator NlpD
MTVNRRAALVGGLSGAAGLLSGCERAIAQTSKLRIGDIPVNFKGIPQQSGFIIGETTPGARIDADGIETLANVEGQFVVGFDRDAPPISLIKVSANGQSVTRQLNVTPRTYQVRAISGLPSATVTPPPEAMAKIERDAAIKRLAFESKDQVGRGYLEAFRWPLDSIRVTSPWGAVRKLNGELQRPHYGIDLGAGTGTPIHAPASGLVVLSEPDMHFEGGIIAIDHGQGLISIYLHQSHLIARVGQRVTAGEVIGRVGSKGRATGPHLCWRMRWRGRNLDPSLRVG